jgi:CheY-like chemotaxis protein
VSEEPMEILLVEDNFGDVLLAARQFRNSRIPNRLYVVGDGEEALNFLYRRGRHTGAVRPDVVLLDLNLPKKGGMEVLAAMKGDAGLKAIPVVVLTSSKAEEDESQARALDAARYLTKPAEPEGFSGVVRTIEEVWLTAGRPAVEEGHE